MAVDCRSAMRKTLVAQVIVLISHPAFAAEKYSPHPAKKPGSVPWRMSGAFVASNRTSLIDKEGRSLIVVATQPITTKLISVDIKSCDFRVVHERRSNIAFLANYSNHWTDQSGALSQIDKSDYSAGVYSTVNGNMVVTGNSVNITSEGIIIDNKKFVGAKNRGGESGVRIEPGGMFINGQRVKGGSVDEIHGTEADIAQLLVPIDYEGDLELKTDVATRADFWLGSMNVSARRPLEFEVGHVRAIDECNLDCSGSIFLKIGKLNSTDLNINVSKAGRVKIDRVDASNVSLTSSEKGEIKIVSGLCHAVKTEGEGKIEYPAKFESSKNLPAD